jgi:nucleoside-diphosphate-sugar epimerase
MIRKISITGSSSLLGKNVISLLKKNLLSLSKRKKDSLFLQTGNIKKKDQVYYGNLENKQFVTKFLSKSDCIINIAFDNNHYKKNVKIIRNLINASNTSKTIKKFIHISTAVVVGKNYKDEITEDENCNPINEYQKIKLKLENEIISNLSENIELIIIRPTEIADYKNPKSTIFYFKKRCNNSLINFFFRFILNDRILNFVSIENVSNAIVFFVKKKKISLKKKNIFFISEDKKNNNFTFYYNYFTNKKLSLFIFNSNLKKILFKFLYMVILKKPNPFQIYSNKKIKSFGFKFKNKAKNHLKKIKYT